MTTMPFKSLIAANYYYTNVKSCVCLYFFVLQPSISEDLFASLDQLAGKEIFLSYTHTEDVEPFVMQLQKGLEERGFSVWLHKTDISLGLDLPIATGMQVESQYLILIDIQFKFS